MNRAFDDELVGQKAAVEDAPIKTTVRIAVVNFIVCLKFEVLANNDHQGGASIDSSARLLAPRRRRTNTHARDDDVGMAQQLISFTPAKAQSRSASGGGHPVQTGGVSCLLAKSLLVSR